MLGQIASKESKFDSKTLSSIDSSLKSILKIEEKTLRINAAKESREKKAAGDFMLKGKKVEQKQKKEEKKKKDDDKKKGGGLSAGIGLTAAALGIPALAKAIGTLTTAVGVFSGLGRSITSLQETIGDQRGVATIGEGEAARKINRSELGDKLINMRSVRSRGKYNGEDLTEKQSETLDKNIKLLEKLSNRIGMTKSLNDQLYDKKEKLKNEEKGTEKFDKLTSEIAVLNKNLTASKEIQKTLISKTNLDPELARRDTLKPREMLQGIPFAVSQSDKDEIQALKASGKWSPTVDDIVQGRQNGGPITVPGSGSGDKVPMMLKPGSFVLNRNASNFLRRQTGGEVPTMLEPGELVYLNENIQRFQTGGMVTENSHPKTGKGWQPAGGTDADGRPLIFTKPAAESFASMMKDGGVKGSDVASSKRSKSHNSTVGGVANSAHLYGEAMDIHGTSKAWMINNSEKYGWRRNNYMNDSWHWDYIGNGSGNTNAGASGNNQKPSVIVLAAGTNDFGTPAPAGVNVGEMVKSLASKNYETNFISPVSTGKFAEVSSSTTQAASKAGAKTYMPTSWASDGYHIEAGEAANIKKKYPGAIIIGDSNAARIEGTNGTPNRTKVGATTSEIKQFVDALAPGIANESGEKKQKTDGGNGNNKQSSKEKFAQGIISALGMNITSSVLSMLIGDSALSAIKKGVGIEDEETTTDSDTSSSNGNDSGTTSSVGATVSEEKLGKNLMKDLGITKDQAAGIVGNLSYESAGLKPDIKEGMTYGNSWEEGRKDIPAGYGWAQWSFDRHDKFVKEHLGGFGGDGGGSKKVATADDNYKYLLEEIRGPEPLKNRPDGRPDMPTTGVKAATDWFRKEWERAGVPADGPRRNIANATVQKLQKGGMVQTLLEPGEMVFPNTTPGLEQLNSTVSRFQSGGEVFEPNYGSPPMIIVNAPTTHRSNNAEGIATGSTDHAATPSLPNGPGMAGLSDIINRVSWSNVF